MRDADLRPHLGAVLCRPDADQAVAGKDKEVLVHGDGKWLWTLTHCDDFAKGFVPQLGSIRTMAFDITSDDVLTWNQITMILAEAAGAKPRIAHVPSDAIAAADSAWDAALHGDSAHSMIFENSNLRSVVPAYVATITLEQAAPEIIAWLDQDSPKPAALRANPQVQSPSTSTCGSTRSSIFATARQ